MSCDAETFDVEHAAAQALVASLERQLVDAKARVKWFNREKRKRTEAELNARFLKRAEPQDAQTVAGSEGHAPASPRGSNEQPNASRKSHKKKDNAIPDGTCPVCWNEIRKGWAGAAHPKDKFPKCRLNYGISMAEHKQYWASGTRSSGDESDLFADYEED